MTITLITGCSTGIGRACAVHFARKGHRVYATMLNPAAGEGLLQQSRDESLDLRVLPLDVTDQASVDVCLAAITGESGPVDLLINNAGISAGGAIEEVDVEVFRTVMETNYFGVLRMMKAVLPSMRERQSGAIVNVSSQACRMAVPTGGPYAASKWALEALSECLAAEVRALGIRVHLIEPGVIPTAIYQKPGAPPDPSLPYARLRRRAFAQVGPLVRNAPAQAKDVAQVIDDAIAAPTPKLRHLVGWDAEHNIAGRNSVTDEEWLDSFSIMTDEEVAAFWRDKFHLDPVTFQPLDR